MLGSKDSRFSIDTKHDYDLQPLCEAIAEASPLPMAAVHGAGHIIFYVNPRFCELTGKAAEQFIGQPFACAVEGGDSCLPSFERVYRTGQAESCAPRETSPEHPLYWSHAAWPIIAKRHRIVGVMFQVTVTNHAFRRTTAMNEALLLSAVRQHENADELSEAAQAAETEARTKSSFLATMSHEIRTPMHGVLGTLDLLAETGLNAEQLGYLQSARNSSTTLLALLNDILDLSKMEAGRMNLHVAPFNLKDSIVEAARLLRAQAEGQGNRLSVLYDTTIPEVFEGDEIRVRQMVFNLVGNAVKFTTEGDIAIEVAGEQNQNEHWSLKIAVRDSGVGIPEDQIPLLFQQFVQAGSPANRPAGGSGLGLAISHRLAALMEGTITVQSEPGVGSTFAILVALRKSEAAVHSSEPTTPVSRNRFFNADVLLAEDNKINQMVATRMLTRLGCKVTLAENGREAVDMAARRRFPIILMDCQMPEMDGFEATRLIRAGLNHEPVIIALTANSLPGDRERCLQAGMTDYMAKPFQLPDMVRLLDRYLVNVPPDGGLATSR